jgi:aspartyl-tRNA(Asn)/glutamyl-tRNA(Gln) amidotransferase subunit B
MDPQKYETVIGLEVHAQLRTKTKLFCGCSTEFGKTPNTLTCPVCLGLPGALPVLNAAAAEMAAKLALAVHARINLRSQFSRKNYFYPDLPKGYQITQYRYPIAEEGWLRIDGDGRPKKIGIERLNLEEDAGKSIHDGLPDSSEKTSLDFNRSGVPLLEIVGRPDLASSAEAAEFLQLLRATLQYLEICDGNMEEGSLRCDANLSLKEKGSSTMGVKTEIKNLNSFRFLQKALDYEAERQAAEIESGRPVRQETRLWDPVRNRTWPMRSKEEAHDYRYFPEPDLPLLVLDENFIGKAKAALPELPQEKVERLIEAFRIPAYDANLLAQSRDLADYFERTATLSENPKAASNWIMREVLQYLHEHRIEINQFPIPAERLAGLIGLIDSGALTLAAAKDIVFPKMIATGKEASAIAVEEGLGQIADEEALKKTAREIVAAHPGPLKQYREGKRQVFGFFVGLMMKETKGRANPTLAHKILKEILDGDDGRS